jgi:hypothetical protein
VALFVHPLVFGAGTRPFDLRGRVDLRLREVRPFNSGVTLLRFRPRS